MEEKNELNDLFLGEETKSGGNKKIFLIIAGALLVFFVTIGVMKFVNSGEDKNQNLNATKEAAVASNLPKDVNTTVDSNATPNDEKLNEIVRKLQEDAKNQSMQSTPLDTNSTIQPKTTVVTVPTQQAPKPAEVKPKPVAAPVATTPSPAPVAKQEPVAPAQPPKEVMKSVATPAPKPAEVKPKPVVQQAPKPAEVKPKPVAKPVEAKPVEGKQNAPQTNPSASSSSYYVQVGYDNNEKNIHTLASKANAAGYKSTNRQAKVGDKDVTKVLVGPFNTKEEAQNELAKLKQQVSAGAFITK